MSDINELSPERIGCITASRIADVMAGGKGLTRAAYAAELAMERYSGIPCGNDFSSAAMDHGNAHEAEARMQYELRNGVMVEGNGKSFIPHPFIPRSGCSPDGMIGDDGLVEIKCPQPRTFIEYYLEREIPTKYRWQMLWQVCCTRRSWNDFVPYHPNVPDLALQIRLTPTSQEITDLERNVRMFDAEVQLLVDKIIALRGK